MLGLTDRDYFLLGVIFYGISTVYSVCLWRRGFQQDDRINYGMLAVAMVFHSTAMVKRGFSIDRCPVNNLYEAMLFIAWCMMAICLAVGAWPRLRHLGAFASPLAFCMGVFALMPALDTPGTQPELAGSLRSLHAASILLALGAFGLGAVAGTMFLTQDYDLKHRKLRAVLSLLPPIQRLELVMVRLLGAGFVLLTVGLLAGLRGLARLARDHAFTDSSVLWAVVVWLIYAMLLLARWRFAQRGRRLAWGLISGFAFVLLTFWGFLLLSAIHFP